VAKVLIYASLGCTDRCAAPLPPHTATRFPPRYPCHTSVEQVRNNRFFQRRELANASSSRLNNEKMPLDATGIKLRLLSG